jgi:hypothetical protein
VVPDVVDRKNVRMIQGRDRLGFLLEAAQAVTIARERFRENLQRNVARQARVASAVNFTHPTCAYERFDFVRTEFCAWG